MARTKEQGGDAARIAALEQLISGYQDSYYNGEAEISDAEFDSLWDELGRLAPESPVLRRVGRDSVDGFPKARHLIPMGSQEKAANPAEFLDWVRKRGASEWAVQYKLDGASLELQYEGGRLARAITRGDGIVGDEITANALKMAGVLAELDLDFTGGVRGEVLMARTVWKKKYADKANPRNGANGVMRRKDGIGCEDLLFIAYDAAQTGNDGYFTDEIEKIRWLAERGFRPTETVAFSDPRKIIDYRQELSARRGGLDVDIDGLVVKDRRTDMEDLRRTRPEKQIAFKFDLEAAVSVLRQVEWSESGATYTPIGIVDPVRLAGTTVRRANLNNPGMIRALGLKIGAKVVIVKRGEIIPKIEGLAPKGDLFEDGEGEEIRMPSVCGTCGSPLEDSGFRLFCPNPECSKRLLHQVEKWVSVLDIRELGEKLLGQLYKTGRVRRISDLYTLTAEELAGLERMGEILAAKVIRNLKTPRMLSLAAFVAGFDFDGVGEIIMDKAAAAGYNTLEKLRAASVADLAGVYGLGEITARTIIGGLAESREEMDRVLAAGFVSIAPPPDSAPFAGLSFCFTGELSSMRRPQAEARVKALGGLAKSQVTRDLSYLVTNNPESGSSKNRKAKELGVPVLSEAEFLDLLSNPENLP